MNNADQAVQSFRDGMHCAQAVLTAYSEPFGLDKGTALRVAAGFGAGMARMQETCGAVTGAVMVLGLKMINKNTDGDTLRNVFYGKVQDLFRKFADKNGSTNCRELLDCDLKTPEGQKTFHESGLKSGVCEKCVRDACEILEEMPDIR